MFAIPSSVLKSLYYLICLFFILFILKSCEKATTPFNPTILSLKPEYIGVTDADLRLTIKNLELPIEFQLIRNDSLVVQGSLTTTDTLLRDTLLLPAHSYTYQAILLKETKRFLQSEKVGLTTMDTTSHEFQWETFTFGFGSGSSYLNDVVIINDSDIWAVGEIHTPETDRFDSLGNWIDPYNVMHWNGVEWKSERIYFNYQGSNLWSQIYSVFAIDEDDVWFGIGSLIHWNGINFESIKIPDDIFPSRANKMWGKSSDDFYLVGNNGFIVHYNRGIWQKLESGIDLPITDIWGTMESLTDEPFILCTATEKFSANNNKILEIKPDHTISEIPWPFGSNRDLHSVWFKNTFSLFICGDGVVRLDPNYHYHTFNELPRFFMNRIRGNDINDIYIVGAFGLISHFNGMTWWTNSELINGTFKGLDVGINLAIAVGEKDHNACITNIIRK